MEPLRPAVREALKQAHPGLTDETIDRVEELLSLRFLVNPDEDPLRIEQLDRQRAELVRREMPRYEQVLQKLEGQ
jgi:hypothetical protein